MQHRCAKTRVDREVGAIIPQPSLQVSEYVIFGEADDGACGHKYVKYLATFLAERIEHTCVSLSQPGVSIQCSYITSLQLLLLRLFLTVFPCVHSWLTWGNEDFLGESERGRVRAQQDDLRHRGAGSSLPVPPYEADGFSRVAIDSITGWVLSRFDGEGDHHHSCAVSFRRGSHGHTASSTVVAARQLSERSLSSQHETPFGTRGRKQRAGGNRRS